MAKRSEPEEEKKSLMDTIREDRYVLIVSVAVLIFIASSSIALFSGASGGMISPIGQMNITVEGGSIALSWAASQTQEVTGYEIYRSAEEGALGRKINAEQVKGLAYSDEVAPGTYFYTVRAAVNETDDGNTRQFKVAVGEIIPTALSIRINDGENYTKSADVILHLSAENAKECRYKNDEGAWSAWEPYKVEKIWKLSEGGDGTRAVAYRCRNTGESETVSASVLLDRNAPLIAYAPVFAGDRLQLHIIVKEALSPSVDCTITLDGARTQAKIPVSSGAGSYIYERQVADGEHAVGIKCTDEAWNSAELTRKIVK